jgi:threonine dehydrogenase-like Zn-dependent dehydrogenase
MRHYYLTGREQVALFEEEIPSPGPGEIQVKIAYSAISPGSNVFAYKNGSFGGADSGRRGELVYMGSGTVSELGDGVTEFAIGDRVAVTGNGHAEYVTVPVNRAGKVPAGLSLRDASMIYLSSWSLSALHLGRYEAAQTVAVVGQGLVGASAALMADNLGARVLTVEVDPVRAAFSRSLGVGPVIQPGAAGADEALASFTGENGIDVILETSGAWPGFSTATTLARDWTRIVLMGIYRTPPSPETVAKIHGDLYGYPSKLHYQRLQIIGAGADPEEVVQPAPNLATRIGNFRYALERAALGRLPVGKLISHVLTPEKIGDALALFATGDKHQVGVVFEWGEAC